MTLDMFFGEFLGTMMLVFLGNSVVANVILKKTKANDNTSGWTVITLGWMVAVAVPVMMFGFMSGAHFNPAVTVGQWAAGIFPAGLVLPYIGSQMAGGFVGAIVVYIFYRTHFNVTDDKDAKLGVFSTGPAIRSTADNCISEFIATFVLVFAIMGALVASPDAGGTAIGGGLGIAWIILALGTALGGTTGYALNPARDLSPRIAYAILPIKDKRDPDWGYSWIPTIMPLLGGLAGGFAGGAVFTNFL
ncbi:MAG: aquaporin family protein [Clostridiales bacterium]|jgi:glycerol uptake facilitator protein|nr:aquaporin family protein [Clostridiales bacterium]